MKYFDNVRVNHKLSFLILAGYLLYYTSTFGIKKAIIYSVVSTIIYYFSSAYFQPDLDQKVHRPGRSSFPFGVVTKNEKIKKIFFPITLLWYYIWLPYGNLLTHRGISHWPIVGVYTRIAYLYILTYPIKETVSPFFKIFFNFEIDLLFILIASPIFIADFIHFFFDMLDSIRNNTPFKSYAQEPGILAIALNPKLLKYHKKGLRGAKRQERKRKKSKKNS